MEAMTNSALSLMLSYGSFSLYSRVHALNITFREATSDYIASEHLVKAILELPIDPRTVCTLLNHTVSQSKVTRLVKKARQDSDHPRMNRKEFRKLIVLQSGLWHLRMSRPYPHTVTGTEVFDLLLRSISQTLKPSHTTSVQVLKELTSQNSQYDHPLKLDVGDTIKRMGEYWLCTNTDFLCIQTVFKLLYHCAYYLGTY